MLENINIHPHHDFLHGHSPRRMILTPLVNCGRCQKIYLNSQIIFASEKIITTLAEVKGKLNRSSWTGLDLYEPHGSCRLMNLFIKTIDSEHCIYTKQGLSEVQ